MSEKDDVRKRSQRVANIESLEARLALTAAPVADFSLDAFYASQVRTEADYQVLESLSLAKAHDITGMHSIFANYGLYGEGQTIAVIDTGIAWDHIALGGGFGPGYRVVGGWDFAENDANPYDDAPAGFHGTHVAGIISSNHPDNPGVAQGVDLVALRVFDDKGNGSLSWVEKALQWVYDNRNKFENPITTVNLSLGTNWNSTSVPNWSMLEDEFRKLNEVGIFIAVAAGNSFQNYGTPGLSYPASSPYVTPVGSVNPDGSVSYFSQRHDRAIFAPGANIRSSIPDAAGNNNGIADDWASVSGTSMATPYVAAVSALVRQAMQFSGKANVNQTDIYDHLRRTADRVWDGATGQYYLRINVGRAIDALMPRADNDSAANPTANLGVLRSSLSMKGQIQRKQDVDYFTFTAGQSGVVRVSAKTDFELVAKWGVIGATGQMKDGAFEFRVEAGKQYTITLGTGKGVGNYSFTATLSSTQQQLTLSATADAAVGAKLQWNISSNRAEVTIFNRVTGAVVYQGVVSGNTWNGQLAAGNYAATVKVDGQTVTQNFAMPTRVLGMTYDVSSSGQTTVRWNGMEGASFYLVRVTNALGQRVSEFRTTDTNFSIQLPSGSYSISVAPNARGSEILKIDAPATTFQMAQSVEFVGPLQSISRLSVDAGGAASAMASATNTPSSGESSTTRLAPNSLTSTLAAYAEQGTTQGLAAVNLEEAARSVLERKMDPIVSSIAARVEEEVTAVDELFRQFEEEA